MNLIIFEVFQDEYLESEIFPISIMRVKLFFVFAQTYSFNSICYLLYMRIQSKIHFDIFQ